MKRLFTFIFILFSFFAKADYWTQKANYPGVGLVNTCAFSIGIKGYVCCGGDGNPFTQELWEYDSGTNVWIQKASLPGQERAYAFAFSIGNKGFVGTGLYANALQDFWEYNPALNAWTQKADFGGGGRISAVGFSIGNMGYAGTGSDDFGDYHDFWQYDPLTNTWTQKAPVPGLSLFNSIGFAIGNYGYVAGGFNSGYTDNVWQYNSITNAWVQKASIPTPRMEAAAFSICDKGYFGTGHQGMANWLINDFWEYNPVTDIWVQKVNYMGSGLYENIGLSIGTKGYIGLGTDTNFNYHNDFWEYTPDSACTTSIEELTTTNLEFTITPNPSKDYIVINIPGFKNLEYLTITDIACKKVYESKLLTSDFRLPTSNFKKGIYLVELTNGKEKAVKKFVKE